MPSPCFTGITLTLSSSEFNLMFQEALSIESLSISELKLLLLYFIDTDNEPTCGNKRPSLIGRATKQGIDSQGSSTSVGISGFVNIVVQSLTYMSMSLIC
jgi:hypothetical protein